MSKQPKYLLTIFMLLFTSVASLATCTVTEQNADYSADNGSSNTASLTANINAVGDLVVITAWCYGGSGGCAPVSATLGGQTAVKTTVSGIPGPGSPGEGQGFIYYVLSAAAAGSQTLTFTASGTHTDIQTSYIDFTPSAGCKFSHGVDSSLGSCQSACANSGNTNPGTINAPSITPTAGQVLINFTWTSEHVDSVGSPWSCPVYSGPGETQTCEFVNTINAAAYVLSASPNLIANNMTDIHATDTWQALITSFSMTSGGNPPPNPPTGLAARVQ